MDVEREKGIRDYVRREGLCEPDEVVEVPDILDEGLPVFKVTVKSWDEARWAKPSEHPDFWLVCTGGMTNLYSNRQIVPKPHLDEQPLDVQADYARSMHVGMMHRMAKRQAG